MTHPDHTDVSSAGRSLCPDNSKVNQINESYLSQLTVLPSGIISSGWLLPGAECNLGAALSRNLEDRALWTEFEIKKCSSWDLMLLTVFLKVMVVVLVVSCSSSQGWRNTSKVFLSVLLSSVN